MKPLQFVLVAVAVLALSAAAAAQTRGMGRIFGTVKDANGQPVADAQIKATKAGDGRALTAKSSKKGDWAISGMAGGAWDVDISKDGYQTKRVSVQVSEIERLPSMDIVVSAVAKKTIDPNDEIRDQLQKGDALFNQKLYPEARKVYEDLLVKYPEAWQLELRIARDYAAEGQPDQALAHLKSAQAKQPDNVEVKLLTAAELVEMKRVAEANALLASIDMAKVKDPVVFLNAGIALLNQNKAAEAKTIFDQVIQRFPDNPDGYNLRGRTFLALSRFPEAKADLQKFVAMAPADSPEVAEAKKILEQLK